MPYFEGLVIPNTVVLGNSWFTVHIRPASHIMLVTPKANSSFGRLSLQFSVANDWNKLQKSLKLETYLPH